MILTCWHSGLEPRLWWNRLDTGGPPVPTQRPGVVIARGRKASPVYIVRFRCSARNCDLTGLDIDVWRFSCSSTKQILSASASSIFLWLGTVDWKCNCNDQRQSFPRNLFLAAYLKLRSFYVHCFHPSFRSDCYTRVYSKFYVIHPSFIWGFPKIGVPIFDGMFPYKPYFLRYLHLWKPPYPVFIPLHLVTSFSWMV